MTAAPPHHIGRPTVPINGYSYELTTHDLLPSMERVLGVATPTRISAGTTWVQLPSGGGASSVTGNEYGQWQRGSLGPTLGDYAEWEFGAIRSEEGAGLYMWCVSWLGPNLGKFQVHHNGVLKGTIDTYAGAYQVYGHNPTTLIAPQAGVQLPPQRSTIRFTQVARNAASTADFLLLTSLAIYSV